MSYKTIATILQSTEDTKRVLDFTIPLSQLWGAHIIAIHAEAIPVAYSAAVGFPDVGLIETASEAAEERTKDVEGLCTARMKDAGQPFDWHSLRSFSGDSAYTGASIARSADLVVVAQRDPKWASEDAPSIEGVLYEAGRPVLVVPHSGALTNTFGRILISWNGSREAARAAFDALPLIVDAESTEIFMVDPSDDDDFVSSSGSALAAALSRHGAEVVVASEASNRRHVDEVIRDRATAIGADLLVLGAHSHSWVRELLFGGVTQNILKSCPITALLSR